MTMKRTQVNVNDKQKKGYREHLDISKIDHLV